MQEENIIVIQIYTDKTTLILFSITDGTPSTMLYFMNGHLSTIKDKGQQLEHLCYMIMNTIVQFLLGIINCLRIIDNK